MGEDRMIEFGIPTAIDRGRFNRGGASPSDLPDWWPSCLKCKKLVDSCDIQHVIIYVPGPDRRPEIHATGEVIVTFSCHGETSSISNKRGPIDGAAVRLDAQEG